jgi:hypothetical protein
MAIPHGENVFLMIYSDGYNCKITSKYLSFTFKFIIKFQLTKTSFAFKYYLSKLILQVPLKTKYWN